MTNITGSHERVLGAAPPDEITPEEFLDSIEGGKLGRHLGSWMTPPTRAEVEKHYKRHAEN
jgi:hypothetical protein